MAVSSHSAQTSHQHTCINFVFGLGGKAEFKGLKTRECFSKDPEQSFRSMAVTPQAQRLHKDILNSTAVFHFGPVHLGLRVAWRWHSLRKMVFERRSSRWLKLPPLTLNDKNSGIGVTHSTWKSGRDFLRLSKSKQQSLDYYGIKSYGQQTGGSLSRELS